MRAQTYGPALLNINYMHAESLSMRMDRNLGIDASRVELLRLVALFEILANVNGIGGCIGIPEDVCRLIATVSSVTQGLGSLLVG